MLILSVLCIYIHSVQFIYLKKCAYCNNWDNWYLSNNSDNWYLCNNWDDHINVYTTVDKSSVTRMFILRKWKFIPCILMELDVQWSGTVSEFSAVPRDFQWDWSRTAMASCYSLMSMVLCFCVIWFPASVLCGSLLLASLKNSFHRQWVLLGPLPKLPSQRQWIYSSCLRFCNQSSKCFSVLMCKKLKLLSKFKNSLHLFSGF